MDETGIAEEDVIGKEGLQEAMWPIENREGTECSGQGLSCLGVPFFMVKSPVDQGTPYTCAGQA